MREPLTKLEQQAIDDYEDIVREVILDLDPIGFMRLGTPIGEYDSDIREITLRLSFCCPKNLTDVATIMYVVFAYMYDLEEAGSVEKYMNAAAIVAVKGGIIKYWEKKRKEESTIVVEEFEPPKGVTEGIVKRDIDECIENIKDEDQEDLEKRYPHIYKRYKRKVMAHPEGAIVHDGDCYIYSTIRICTCGLHHYLKIKPGRAEKIYPPYWKELKGIYDMEELVRTQAEGDN